METDAGRSTEVYKDLARTMSFDFSNTFFSPDEHIPVTDQGKSPNAPPSPLFVSGSDTESSTSNSAGLTHDHNTSSSAPKIMDYFRFSKEDPDRAWHEVERQRRSSMQPALRRPAPSTESLTSLWHQEAEMGQSSSGGGKLRAMTPLHGYVSDKERRPSGSAERSAPIPVRPIPRSNLSHTSLVGSSSSYRSTVLPADLGSAPSHTLGLLHSYASAFSVRSSSNTPSSYSQRGFVYPDGTVVPSREQIARQVSHALWEGLSRLGRTSRHGIALERWKCRRTTREYIVGPVPVPMRVPTLLLLLYLDASKTSLLVRLRTPRGRTWRGKGVTGRSHMLYRQVSRGRLR